MRKDLSRQESKYGHEFLFGSVGRSVEDSRTLPWMLSASSPEAKSNPQTTK